MVDYLIKRDGRIVKFNQQKIMNAVFKALTATGKGDVTTAKKLSEKVVKLINLRFKEGEVPTVEQVQDIVEEVLILEGFVEVAKSYILYREQRRRIREAVTAIDEASDLVDNYIGELDWEIYENANMAYSLQGLNHYVVSHVTKRYWLNKIYPKEVREAHLFGDLHIHNLDTLAPYCCGWDLLDLLTKGFRGASGKVESRPAKHFRTALGQLVNFFYTLQGESAGAQAISSFDTLLAPFIRYDGLDYNEVKQALQEFFFNCSVPTRVGFQTPFTNITLDIKPKPPLSDLPVVVGGRGVGETYGEFEEEIRVLVRAFYEVGIEGDAKGRPFTFPIPTINITKDFEWDSEFLDPMWEATAKYGINYFANFVNSDMRPEDVRSMCCRLRLDTRELYKRGGGLFGSNPLTGSIGVVTINLSRIGYLSKTRGDFFERLERMMEIAKEALEVKRKALEDFMEKGLYPYSRFYLSGVKKLRGSYFGNHFSTIGVVGMNEALLNFMGEDIGSKEGRKFAISVLDFMRKKLVDFQQETGNLYNLEATPAESTAYRLAKMDKERFPDIITAGGKEPYYTNSSQLPVNYTGDLFEALELQEELQTRYTGGTVFHVYLGESVEDAHMIRRLLKRIFENFRMPYLTFTPTFSICPTHGYIGGKFEKCPKCGSECEVYSRIVGYLRPVKQWNRGKREEFKERVVFSLKNDN